MVSAFYKSFDEKPSVFFHTLSLVYYIPVLQERRVFFQTCQVVLGDFSFLLVSVERKLIKVFSTVMSWSNKNKS